jgi:GTP-binding nuclear protein Ran
MESFKLVVVGDKGVGKSAFLKRHQDGSFLVDEVGKEVVDLVFNTTRGKICANCWDSTHDFAMHNASVGIIMFDLSNRDSFESIVEYHKKLTEMTSGMFIVLVGNKCDNNRKVKPYHIREVMDRLSIKKYCDLSVKANFNFEKPFLYALRHVTGDSKLDITV